jgi:probable phosphoglycerate mutase
MIRIGLVRHGTTDWNREGRAQGHSDIPLDETGLMEAEKLAERIGGEKWDRIYSSDLLRAKQTAEAIERRKGIAIRFDTRLRERSGGMIEGTTEEERLHKWGPDWRNHQLGMETADSVIKRGLSFLEEVGRDHPDENILVVTHGAFIKYLLTALLPQDGEPGESILNTSLTSLIQTGDNWEPEIVNSTMHLIDS